MWTQWESVSSWDRVFDDVMGTVLGAATAAGQRTFEPAIDVHASETELVFVCDVPGVKQEDLEVTLENHVLTIKGTRKLESQDQKQVLLGRAYGTFRRAFTLPDALDEGQLAANLDAGVLTVRIPKQPKIQPRKIAIGNGHKALGG